jgi:hypothetical protein
MATIQAKPFRPAVPPRVDFHPDRFNTLLEQKGYDALWQRMTICPCRKELTTQAQNDCINCHGTGHYYFGDTTIRVLITNAMMQRNFVQQWSEVLQGTVNISVLSSNKVGWLDSFAILDAETVYSEVGTLLYDVTGDFLYIIPHYTPLSVTAAFEFVDVTSVLTKLTVATTCTISALSDVPIIIFDLDKKDDLGKKVSVTYTYNPVYVAIDLLNDFRNSYVKDHQPVELIQRMPLRMLAKKKHLVTSS